MHSADEASLYPLIDDGVKDHYLHAVAGRHRRYLVGAVLHNTVWTRDGASLLISYQALIMVTSSLTALVIFWRRSDDWMALLFALTLLSFGATASRSLNGLGLAYPALRATINALEGFTVVLLILAVFLFPDGRFVPRWVRFPAALTVLSPVLFPDLGDLMMSLPDRPEGVPGWRLTLAAALVVGLLSIGLLSQVYRYRYVSGPVERQQTKWILLSISTIFVVIVWMLLWIQLWELSEWFGWSMIGITFVVDLFPVSIAVALLRYRLWDADLLINRALVYSLLTATLGAFYWASVVLL